MLTVLKNTSTIKVAFLGLVFTAIAALPTAPVFAATLTNPMSSQAVDFPISTSLSSNWAGYVADSGSDYTSVTGTWVIPNASTTQPLAADATWVGIGGMATGSTDLIQAGTQAVIKNGTTTYEAWYEILPQASEDVPLTVQAGDTITTSLSESSPNLWTITIADQTTHQEYSTVVPYTSTNSSAEWIQEMPSDLQGNFIPLDNFGQIPFTNATTVLNNSAENLVQSGAHALTIVGSDNSTVYAYPSAIGSDGSSFTVTRTPTQTNVQSSVRPFRAQTRTPIQWSSFPRPFDQYPNGKTQTYTNGSYTVTVTTYSF